MTASSVDPLSPQTSTGPARRTRRRSPRRRALTAAAVSMVVLSGCSFFSTDADTGSDGGGDAADADALEAPSLAQRVADGTLPELDERLPEEALVVEPVDEIGRYGGTWNTYYLGPDDNNAFNPIGYEGLVRWAREYTGATGIEEIIPNLAEFEISEDGDSYTFHLREGIKWSDGEPFDADDIMFWYESVFSNPTLTPSTPDWLASQGEPVTVERVDDYTVRFDFAGPKAFFLHDMAQLDRGVSILNYPEHYMSQFHPDHNPDLDELVAESGFGDWQALFESEAQWRYNPDLPRLTPWVITEPGNTGNRAVAERNPYYWKVDPDGRQLPYLDEVVYRLAEDPEVALLRAVDGEVDLEHRGLNSGSEYPVLVEGQEDGDYWLLTYHYDSMNIAELQLNLTHQDETKREIFNNKLFRMGLSHAINRQEIIDLVYSGQGEPWQTSPLRDTPFYHEQLASQFVEYDVDLANQYLDEAGYDQRNEDGIRLGPDGEPISFTVSVRADAFGWDDVSELLVDYAREVGIDMKRDVISNELLLETRNSNQHDAVFGSGLGGRATMLVPWNYVPVVESAGYGVEWARWYQGFPDAEQPPEYVMEQLRLWDELQATFDPAQQEDLFRQILDIAAEQFYQIGIATPRPEYAVVKNSMRNVPEEMPSGSPYPNPAPYNPEQFFKAE